ncbi:hypothetical protein P40_14685 [Alloalcanivorax xenomutans]|nr:hypothetical protein P40_14685 [Alloalcanivorax xenomutans]
MQAGFRLADIPRASYCYQVYLRNDEALRARLKELATQRSFFGYLLLHGPPKAEGLVSQDIETRGSSDFKRGPND